MTSAKDCRAHANDCERMAEEAKKSETKKSYLRAAQMWRELAEQLEKLKKFAEH